MGPQLRPPFGFPGPGGMAAERRYHALRFIQGLRRVLAWIGLGAAVIGGLELGSQVPLGGGEGVGLLVGALCGGLIWVGLMSDAETISVMIDMEENTRKTAEGVAELVRKTSGP